MAKKIITIGRLDEQILKVSKLLDDSVVQFGTLKNIQEFNDYEESLDKLLLNISRLRLKTKDLFMNEFKSHENEFLADALRHGSIEDVIALKKRMEDTNVNNVASNLVSNTENSIENSDSNIDATSYNESSK